MEWLAAVLGLVGAVVGSVITGIVEFIIMKKTLENDKLKLRLELKEKFNKIANPDSDDACDGWREELEVYKQLLNELYYLNIIANPKKNYKENGKFPYIENNIAKIVGGCELPQDIAKLLGELRCNIDIYNSLLKCNTDISNFEMAINKIYNLINPIREEQFKNYMTAKDAIRNYSRNEAENLVDCYKEVNK